MENRYVNILGEEYKVITEVSIEDDEYLKKVWAYCDSSVKKIVVSETKEEIGSLEDLKKFKDEATRHEVIHAFLDESGLKENSNWARNEEMVDFFAIQFPKIIKVFKELEII